VNGPTQNPGQHHTLVTCTYKQDSRHIVSVQAEYALPTNLNPYADFYFGCKQRRKQDWDNVHRLFFVSGEKSWSYVTFTDPGRELPNADVPRFETIAKSMLESVEPLAHSCELNTTTPTTVRQEYLFTFEFLVTADRFRAFGGVGMRTPLIPDGVFAATYAGPTSTVQSKIISVKTDPFHVSVTDGGKHYALRLSLEPGSSFVQRPPKQTLQFGVKVMSSNYPKCRAGEHGSLTIKADNRLTRANSPATVRLALCGSRFGQGRTRGTALIKVA